MYFKVDEHSPSPKEAPEYWMGVSDTVGDIMTYNIWCDKIKQILQRSAVRSADPHRGGIPNLRIEFNKDTNQDEPLKS